MHILRNPYGHSEDDVRRARLWAGDRIEELERELAERTRERDAMCTGGLCVYCGFSFKLKAGDYDEAIRSMKQHDFQCEKHPLKLSARPEGFAQTGPLTLDTAERIFFYEQNHYYLSNFSAFRVMWQGHQFDTSEAAYHWEKFPGHPAIRNLIQDAASAHEAFKLAETYKPLRRPDWDNVKARVMKAILVEKTLQHEYVRRKLLATGDAILIENSWRDPYWGWGQNRDGKNVLGRLWMETRAHLREAMNDGAEK